MRLDAPTATQELLSQLELQLGQETVRRLLQMLVTSSPSSREGVVQTLLHASELGKPAVPMGSAPSPLASLKRPSFMLAPELTHTELKIIMPVDLRNLIDRNGRVVFRFSNTTFYMLLGKERAKHIVSYGFFFPSVVLQLTLVALYSLVVVLGLLLLLPATWMFFLATALMFTHVAFLGLVLVDLRIGLCLVRRWNFWANIMLSLAGSLTISAILAWDFRTAIIPIVLLVFIIGCLIDATPVIVRHWVAFPFSIVLLLVVVAMGVCVNLNRFPGQTQVTFTLGDAGGLASKPITYDVTSICSSCLLAMVIFVLHTMNGTHRGRRFGQLGALSVALLGGDEPGTSMLINKNMTARFPFLVRDEEAPRTLRQMGARSKELVAIEASLDASLQRSNNSLEV